MKVIGYYLTSLAIGIPWGLLVSHGDCLWLRLFMCVWLTVVAVAIGCLWRLVNEI